MPLRLPAALVLVALTTSGASARDGTAAPPLRLADQDAAPMTGKERQKACTERWRRFSAAEKAAQGPTWPKFYSRCVKALRARQA